MAGVTPNGRVPRSCSPISQSVDWRKNCIGVNGKLKYVLSNDLLADVTFSVGKETEKGEVEIIRAHKFMLALFSSVFEAMFMGGFKENSFASNEAIIELPDIQPVAFKTLLNFIYMGKLEKGLGTTELLGTLYAARKYDISELEIECLRFLKGFISDSNAVTIFQASQMFEEKELKDEAHAFLRRNFDMVMKNDDFLNISLENLCLFLRDNDTFASELSIFQGVLRWSNSECLRQGINNSPENKRNTMLEALRLIRFPVISSEDIALEVIPSGILTADECTLLLQHKVVNPCSRTLLPALPFSDQQRSFSAYKASFYEEVKGVYVDLSAGWYNRLTVDQPISIVSFGFYGPHGKDNASYNVEIKITRDESDTSPILSEARYEGVVVRRKEIFHVKFPHPVPIHPRIPYRAWFSLDGPLTCHGGSASTNMEVVVPVKTRYERVIFNYQIVGAHQLCEIMFHA